MNKIIKLMVVFVVGTIVAIWCTNNVKANEIFDKHSYKNKRMNMQENDYHYTAPTKTTDAKEDVQTKPIEVENVPIKTTGIEEQKAQEPLIGAEQGDNAPKNISEPLREHVAHITPISVVRGVSRGHM